jgi:hypothetical protein
MNEIQFQLRPRCRGDKPKSLAAERRKLPRVTEVLALAIQFNDMVRRGVARDHADLARLGCVSQERISQIMRLLWLAPDIQQEILTLPRTSRGRFHVGEVTLRRIASRMLWSEQRRIWAALAANQSACYSGESPR